MLRRILALEVTGEELTDEAASQLLTDDAPVRVAVAAAGSRLVVALGRGGLQCISITRRENDSPIFTPVTGGSLAALSLSSR